MCGGDHVRMMETDLITSSVILSHIHAKESWSNRCRQLSLGTVILVGMFSGG